MSAAAPEYGCDPRYDGPPIAELLRQDRHGHYIRESIDLETGMVRTDPQTGAVQFDTSDLPTRHHLRYAQKGYRLLRLVD